VDARVKPAHDERDILNPRLSILPVAQITATSENPSSSSEKHKLFAAHPKSAVWSARSVPPRGRIAIVTDVGMECDGRGLPQRGLALPTNGGVRT